MRIPGGRYSRKASRIRFLCVCITCTRKTSEYRYFVDVAIKTLYYTIQRLDQSGFRARWRSRIGGTLSKSGVIL